jgi:predicted CopG family antitoxin
MELRMTTIAISSETKETLRLMGEKDESYEKIIRRLIKEAGLKKLDDRWNRILEKDEFIPLDEL